MIKNFAVAVVSVLFVYSVSGNSNELFAQEVLRGKNIQFSLSPDSLKVIYYEREATTDLGQDLGSPQKLFSYHLLSHQKSDLTTGLQFDSNDHGFSYQISPDSSAVVFNFVTTKDSASLGNVYYSKIASGTPQLIASATPAIDQYLVTSDSKSVLYRVGNSVYLADISGLKKKSDPKLMGTVPEPVNYCQYSLDAGDAQKVVVSVDRSHRLCNDRRLFVFNADGKVRKVEEWQRYWISKNVSWLVLENSSGDLYSMSLSSSDAPLSLIAKRDGDSGGFTDVEITENSQRVIFNQILTGSQAIRVNSVIIDGTTPKLTLFETTYGDYRNFWISPDSSKVFIKAAVADTQMGKREELMSVSVRGGKITRHTTPGVLRDFSRPLISSDGTKLVFPGDLMGGGRVLCTGSSSTEGHQTLGRADHFSQGELVAKDQVVYWGNPNGAFLAKLSEPLLQEAAIVPYTRQFVVSPNKEFLLYINSIPEDQGANESLNLYSF